MNSFQKSRKLDDVCYDIRGPVMEEARLLEEAGVPVHKLNIGNPAPFGFSAPEELLREISENLSRGMGYVDAKGLLSARGAIKQDCARKGIMRVDEDDIYIGNGVSELIVMAMQGLLNNGDEILVPAPDYPLWTAAISLSGGKAIHYLCDEVSSWFPDMKDVEKKISPRTKGIVIINPNNPTGSVYPEEIVASFVELARKHDLILFSDEIYDRIVYDGALHIPPASLGEDVFHVSFGGLSKVYRAAGFRVGWMVLSGKKSIAMDYIEGLNILSNMRLCSNVPVQFAIPAALAGDGNINEYIMPGGRLYNQREMCYNLLTDIPGLSCVKPMGALYVFPRIDIAKFRIRDDRQFVLDLLRAEHILTVQGTGFNWPDVDHFRIVFLPNEEELRQAVTKIGKFLSTYEQK